MVRPILPPGRWGATLIGVVGIVLWATETSLAQNTVGLPTFEVVALAFAAAACLSPLAWWLTGDVPWLAFQQPLGVWLLTVPSLVAYHACIYYALRWAPAAPAALLQGCTPLFIVVGSALLPGGRLRWWHVAGLLGGMEGLAGLVLDSGGATSAPDSSVFLVMIGGAAGLWGIYSVIASRCGSVPTSAMGVFYAAAAAVALLFHGVFETWVNPTASQWTAVGSLGLLPMGFALFCWDFGLKRGDVRALGVASYIEPLVGAGLVVLLGQGDLRWPMLVSGFVIIGAAVLGAADGLGADPESIAGPSSETAMGDDGAPVPFQHASAVTIPPDLLNRVVQAAEWERMSPNAFMCACLERGIEVSGADDDLLNLDLERMGTAPRFDTGRFIGSNYSAAVMHLRAYASADPEANRIIHPKFGKPKRLAL